MKLTKELIVEVLNNNRTDLHDEEGNVIRGIGEDCFGYAAKEILAQVEDDSDTPPQLNKHEVIRRLPTDEEVKRWFQLLVGKGKEQMMKDVEATFV
jgi:hypothetical protein